MSFIASMVSAACVAELGVVGAGIAGAAATGAAGAGLGAGISALSGGDIGQGALMGGIGGALSGGLGLALAPGAAAAEGAAVAGTADTAATAGANAAPLLGSTAAQSITPTLSSLAPEATQAGGAMGSLGASTAQAVSPAMSSIPTAISTGAPIGTQGAMALNAAVPTASMYTSQAPVYAAVPTAGGATSLPLGQQFMNAMGATPGSAVSQYGGSALQGSVGGIGIQGISNAVQGRPITEGMGTAGIAGGIGGAAATGLASQAGQSGMMGKIGQFAADNPMMTSAGIGMLTTPMVSSAMGTDGTTTNAPTLGIKPNFNKFNPAAYHRTAYAHGGGVAPSGISTLGGYSDGGRLLKGPGDGVSDSIPAVVGGREPARLAEGEFVIPARIVSELGNGSTDAGAKQLYAMMDRVQGARHKSMGKGQFSENTHAARLLPA